MTNTNLGEVVHPRHCRVSVSADKTQLAFTFQSETRTPLTIVLPLIGAAGLQRQLAQCLFLLGVRPKAKEVDAGTKPATPAMAPASA